MGNAGDISSSQSPDGFQTRVDEVESPFEAIVRALAVAKGVEPTALPPLYDCFDPEALDALVGPPPVFGSEPSVAVSFSLEEYRVQITNDGVVTILADSDST